MSRVKFVHKLKSMVAVSAGSAAVFVGINFYKGNEKFYNDVFMPAVRLIAPETAHELAVLSLKYEIFPKSNYEDPKSLAVNFLDMALTNPIGIAAGFDKQGETVKGLYKIGFGFVEIGSITPEPQPGNPKPRVFRLNEDKAIINRYGFNSQGHEAVYNRLKDLRENGNFKGMLGINLGKNKTSENAINDYVKGVKLFGHIADYLVVNISSPNTPGLRVMQAKNSLQALLSEIMKARNSLPESDRRPILLKLAPDLSMDDIKEIVEVIDRKDCKIDGLIISNTTIDRGAKLKSVNAKQLGGLSGAPLCQKSTEMIALVYKLTKGKVPIIGVGGVFSGQDAFDKILAGASVIQLYTSFIYHGPPIVKKVKADLDKILRENGYNNIQEAVGKGADKFV